MFSTKPRIRNKDGTTPAKSTFQQELEAKMRDRRERGLAADVSPEHSDTDDEGLDSDDGSFLQYSRYITL